MGKHRSHTEWRYLIQKYYAQNVTLEQFCGMNNLNIQTFCQYKRAYRPIIEEEEGNPSAFILAKRDEMDKEDLAIYPQENHQVLNLQAGAVQLSLPVSTSPQWLGLLLKEVLK